MCTSEEERFLGFFLLLSNMDSRCQDECFFSRSVLRRLIITQQKLKIEQVCAVTGAWSLLCLKLAWLHTEYSWAPFEDHFHFETKLSDKRTHGIGRPTEVSEGFFFVGVTDLQGHAGSRTQLIHHTLQGDGGSSAVQEHFLLLVAYESAHSQGILRRHPCKPLRTPQRSLDPSWTEKNN